MHIICTTMVFTPGSQQTMHVCIELCRSPCDCATREPDNESVEETSSLAEHLSYAGILLHGIAKPRLASNGPNFHMQVRLEVQR